MTLFQGLMTLGEVNAVRRAIPKGQIPTRLDEKTASDKDEKRDEKAWRKACIKRDGKVCRRCKRVVVVQLELAPERLEVHHLAGRADRAVRWDERNGIVLCEACHEKLTRHVVNLLQAAKHLFSIGQKTYLNARKPITFTPEKAV